MPAWPIPLQRLDQVTQQAVGHPCDQRMAHARRAAEVVDHRRMAHPAVSGDIRHVQPIEPMVAQAPFRRSQDLRARLVR